MSEEKQDQLELFSTLAGKGNQQHGFLDTEPNILPAENLPKDDIGKPTLSKGPSRSFSGRALTLKG